MVFIRILFLTRTQWVRVNHTDIGGNYDFVNLRARRTIEMHNIQYNIDNNVWWTAYCVNWCTKEERPLF